jgi:tetratricopeptide (TPR) repeat protein/DNA-binding winged helix-turn-helix (wHTH) protein
LAGFSIGEHYIEPLTGTVTGPGGSVHLHPKAVEILVCLASKPCELVSHDELLMAAWGDINAGHAVLSSAVGEIRRALGDNADKPKFIQTLPKRGYALLMVPQLAPEQAHDAVRAGSQSGQTRGFVRELNRRGVSETAIAYLVVGWLLVQVADVTFDNLGLPDWAGTYVTYFVFVGFPFALLLAWFMEVTKSGAIVLDRGQVDRDTHTPFNSKYVATVGALVLASIIVYAYDRFVGLPTELASGQADTPMLVEPNTVAVLPFLNIEGGEEAKIFGDGLAEDVIGRLAAVQGIRVSARGDSFALAPDSRSQDVRNRLEVAYYVAGSVRIKDETLRVVARLVDSATGFTIVSRSFDRALGEFAAMQNEITSLIVATLRVSLPSLPEPAISADVAATNFDAYIEYRRGMEMLYRPAAPETIRAAFAAFRRSLAVDPDYAAAYAGICLTYTSGYDLTDETKDIDEAERACGAALARNPNLAVVHDALGDLYRRTGDFNDAQSAYERALAINADDVPALTGLADTYAEQERLIEAEQSYRRAIGLQPGDWRTYNSLGRFLYRNGRYAEAADAYGKVVSVDAENETGWANLAAASMLAGDFPVATRAFERAGELQPTAATYSNLALLHYYLGDTERARVELEKAIEMEPRDYLLRSNLGDVLDASGDPARADEAFAEAKRLARELLAVNSRHSTANIDLAWIEAMLGNFGEAERLVALAREVSPRDPYVPYIDALVRTRMGDYDAALDSLETAIDMGYARALASAEPHFAALRRYPRFAALVGN